MILYYWSSWKRLLKPITWKKSCWSLGDSHKIKFLLTGICTYSRFLQTEEALLYNCYFLKRFPPPQIKVTPYLMPVSYSQSSYYQLSIHSHLQQSLRGLNRNYEQQLSRERMNTHTVIRLHRRYLSRAPCLHEMYLQLCKATIRIILFQINDITWQNCVSYCSIYREYLAFKAQKAFNRMWI